MPYKKLTVLTIMLAIAIFISACSAKQSTPPAPQAPKVEQPQQDDQSSNDIEKQSDQTVEQTLEQKKETEKQETEKIDYEKVKPNEMGEVMVVMYHYFGEKEQEFTRTFENFRKDLDNLYHKGYRLISIDDFVNNNIDVPAGMTPIVFTFDDGPASEFNLIEQDDKLVVDPQSAVGIMMDFQKEHPDFGLEGTFYINETAFAGSKGTEKERLQFLLDLGLDIGNHTFGHTNLAKSDAATIQKVIGSHVKKMREYFPDYKQNTLALPFGAYSNTTFDYIVKGQYEGTEYKNDSILLVGWKPSPPPAHNSFNPQKMLRVRAGEGKEHDMYYYLEFFDKNPNMRYISDGDPETICIPEKNKDQLDADKAAGKKIITY
ncbi:polysaccharide deacetylase family protein [Petroclostridium sp. X23]|uniref:polysaccharide deacetylase family protein n=1 Tax=Petroclostridium sp. X23 TaxID=3045146 RepID=UPI0024AE7119|nr:polysaccharide deacetylase family protein [Petroclostridium sp. X23]WHH60383.1 polysaccharide deacetylase family protein [Petroclostridium sp. X23]